MCKCKTSTMFMLFSMMGLMLFCIPPGKSTMAKECPEFPFQCTLELEEKEIPAGEPVNIIFSLKNQTDRPLYAFKWYTPLEGLRGDIFRVEKEDGSEILYRGLIVRRPRPRAADYMEVKPGETVTAVVDISHAYNMSGGGCFSVRFKGRLLDVTGDKDALPTHPDEYKGQEILCNEVDFTIVKR